MKETRNKYQKPKVDVELEKTEITNRKTSSVLLGVNNLRTVLYVLMGLWLMAVLLISIMIPLTLHNKDGPKHLRMVKLRLMFS